MEKERLKLEVVQLTLLFVFVALSVAFVSLKPSVTGYAIFTDQPDPTDGKDTYIQNQSSSTFGDATLLKIGKTAAARENRALLEFNVSSISSSDTITSGVIEVYASSLINPITVEVYRMTSEWNESTTNWTTRNVSQIWTTEGGDFSSTLLDSVTISSASQWYNFSVVEAIRGWVNGSYPNYGIIFVPTSETSDGDILEITSSDYTLDTSLRPKITIDHTDNAAPTISSISIDSNLSNLKKVGEDVTFTVSWSDLESNNAQIFVCSNSTISTSGCALEEFCSTSIASTNPASCAYTIQNSDNRTTNVWISTCDSGDCSTPNATSFNMNHLPNITIQQPNGGETVNQSQGNYSIQFNVSDTDSDLLFADIHYGTSPNSTTFTVASSLNLTNFCTDSDSDTATTNPCTYSWNSSGVFGTYFLTINLNDTYHINNDTSDNSFDVRSLIDNEAPNITAQYIESGTIFSGKIVQLFANVSDPNIRTVWASVNTTPQQNLTMSNSTFGGITYNVSFTAPAVGTYEYKAYANDTIGNTNNSMTPIQFNVTAPNASVQNIQGPSSSLENHAIIITSSLNASDSLRDVYAYLNVPEGFEFVSGYDQNTSTGNYTTNQTKTTTWFVSTPSTSSDYTINATFTDVYGNQWESENLEISVSSTAGGYSLTLSGYPEVESTDDYYIEAFFRNSGTLTDADSTTISIYDSTGSLIVGPASMNNPTTGEYNYTYTVGVSINQGQWETIVNATKDGISYITNQFWRVVGGPFDVRDIEIVDSSTNNLNISVETENTGGVIQDLVLTWNLTKESDGSLIDGGADTFAVQPESVRTWNVYPDTDGFTGDARITFLGYWAGTERAGAYKIFEITETSSGSESPGGSSGGSSSSGGSGGGGGAPITGSATESGEITITHSPEIFLTKNIERTIPLSVENNKQTSITNLELAIDTLPEDFYTITPETISRLSPGDTKKFEITFLITDFVGEHDFNYILTSNEETITSPAKIIVLGIEEFFTNEIERFKNLIDSLLNQTSDSKIIKSLEQCSALVTQLEDEVTKEQFINARSTIEEIELCISEAESKIQRGPSLSPSLSFEMPNLIWIAAGILAILVIVALIGILFLIYKKLSIVSFLQQESSQPKSSRDIKEEHFDEQIKSIEEKLGVQKKNALPKPEVKSKKEDSEDETKENTKDDTEEDKKDDSEVS